MKKLLIIVAILIGLLSAGLAVNWWWLTDTRSGAEWAMNRAAAHLDHLSWDSIDGGLAGGLSIRDLKLEQAGTRVAVEDLQLALRIRPFAGPKIDVERLHLRHARVHLPEPEPPVEPRGTFDPGMLAIPVSVNIADLDLEDFSLHRHEKEPIFVHRLGFAGHYSDRLRIDRLEILAPQGQLAGSGQLALTEPFSTRLDLQALAVIDDSTDQALDLQISGPVASLEVGLTARGPVTASGQARVRGLPEMPSGSIRLDGRLSDWPGIDLALDELRLHAEGDAHDWSLVLDTRAAGMNLPPSRWQIEASGDLARVDVQSLRAEIFDGEITATGWLDHGAEVPAARIDLQMQELDLTTLYPDWPQQARVSGHLAGRVDGEEIHLDRLDLSAPPTALTLKGTGRFLPAADELALDLEWQDLLWPPLLDEGEPLLSSQSGRIRLTGRISDWRLELDALLATPEVPASELGLRATGSDRRADIERLAWDMGDAGRLAAQGEMAWSPDIDTRLEVVLHQIDPVHFVAQLPGRIDARASIEAYRDERWHIGLELTELGGHLRDQALTGSGQVRLTDEVPQAAHLNLALGENRLELGSEDGQRWQWLLDAESVGQLWPGISGMALLEGTLEPYARKLHAQGELEAAGFGDFSVEWAHVDTALDWGEFPQAEISLRLNDLDLNPWDRIDQIELVVEGDCDNHHLELNLSGMRGTLDLAGRGTLEGCLTHTQAWQGHIERLYLGETVAGNWQLAEVLPIRITDEATEAGPGCLRAIGNDDGRLCLRELRVDDDSHARIGIHKMPMDLLLLPLDPVFTLTTPLSGQLDAEWGKAGLKRLAGHLDLEAGALRALGGDEDLLTIEQVRLDFTPEGEHGLLINLLARLEGDSELTSRAHVIDLRDPANALINADARLDLPDIGAFNHLVTELDQLGGRLHGRLMLAGTLASPSINGRLALVDGHLMHAPLGLRVTDIGINLEGVTDRASLVGHMQSGAGELSLGASLIQQDDGWRMEAGVDGSRFSFADIEWLKIEASPSVRIEGTHDRLDIDGDIHIDRLRGGLPPGAGERVTSSGDVIVLGETDEEDVPRTRRLHGRLGIHLGDDARLSALGLQARLADGLDLLWNGTREPRGRGAIRIPEGFYRAYGQNLNIRDGEILFTGHPLNNPRLDIQAVREIFGDPRVEAAGVHIRGPAQQPQIDLFTDPPTTDEKALAFIVTGADFDHATGQAAVSVGFYLLPRLFVSYGFGLFEAGNVLSGRYELSDRWGIRVVSGERDTGVDLGFITDR